jgi:hypothetical protein
VCGVCREIEVNYYKLKIHEEIFLKRKKRNKYVIQRISRGNKSGKPRATKFHCVQGNVLDVLFEFYLIGKPKQFKQFLTV